MQFKNRNQKSSAIHHIILASAIAVICCLVWTQSAFAAFPTDWTYRKSHVVNPATGAGTDYQVRITAHYGDDAGGSNDSGENVYLNSLCQTDFGDVRFVSSDGVTELDYWMETGSKTDSVSAVFWVKVDDDLGTANQTIYVYYGYVNATAATTTSDGDNTFIFFDDFDVDLAKWEKEKELAPGVITLNAASSYVRCGGGSTSNPYGHTSLGSSPAYTDFTDGAIELRLKQSTDALGEIAYRGDFAGNTGYKGRFDCRTGTETPHMRPPYTGWGGFGTAVTRFGIGTDTWFRGSVTVTSSGGSYTHRIFKNDLLMSSTTDTTYAGPGEIALQNHYGSYSDYDWVAVRKFVYPEPADDVWGAEEPLAANVSATKSVNLVTDLDGNGVITPGDTMRYNVKIYNTGNVAALGTELTDILPAETTYAGAWTATNGTVTHSAGQISWTGYVTADPTGVLRTVITFDVTVNSGTLVLPPDPPTVVSNQGTVSYDSDNDGLNGPAADILTDGDPYAPDVPNPQTTDFFVGSAAQATGTKTATLFDDADGNGVITPGDTLEYEIVITNMTGFPSAGIEITDVIPLHTTYVALSTIVTDRDGNSTTVEPSPPIYPETLDITDISIGPAGSGNDVVTITFQVLLDDPMAAGVTQISNQAVGFYDSDTDGFNDTHQETDSDPATLGNQPTVTDLYVGTISGTVFDDNGYAFGTAGDGIQNGGEPGISGVTVGLYDDAFTLLYGTEAITDFDGYFIFTGLPPGNYGVRETIPTYYALSPPTTNDVTVTLDVLPATGDSEVVNFGNQANGHADLMVVKNCTTITPDGTNQLVFVITVTNEGPDNATNVVLTDDLTSLTGLSDITYTVDSVVPAPPSWSGSYDFGTINYTISHTVRIYADVSETFSPIENTATVVSDIFDPTTDDNTSSCTNLIDSGARKALTFNPAAYAQVVVASAPSLELTTSGTIEAWIYVDEFQANSELIGKGTVDETFDIGLCGGVSGDEFEGGSAQNIGFALYENDGTQRLLIADTQTLNARQWYHIACTWTGTALDGIFDMKIYINGIEKKSQTVDFVNVIRENTEELKIGFNHLTGGRFIGTMDEVRIWNVARTQARIRDTLCHKITDAESDYTVLMGNWRFDEDSGIVCNDTSAYGNIGTTHAERVCSSAPIGDASDYDYVGSVATDFEILNFTSGFGDSMTITGDGGTWHDNPAPPGPPYESVLQVYRVDDAPENNGQPLFWKSMGLAPHYWGVFKSGGTDPTYKVVYNYAGYPYTNEATINLAFRNHNCESWKSAYATQDIDFDTLTRTGFTGTEFILGQDVDPRNAIDFDSTSSQYVQAADGGATSDLDPTTYGTVEAWINLSSYQSNAGIIHKGDGTADSYSLYMGTGASSNLVYFTVDAGGGTSTTINSTSTLSLSTWYHIAGTWDDSAGVDTMVLYINGVQETSTTPINSAQDTDGVTANLYIGNRPTGPTYFNGYIDEVRVWTVTRNQTNIRDYMCRKLTGSESGLGGYWRFDEETTSATTPDYDFGTANDGTMFGFGTAGNIIDARTCSAAPIGDDSAYTYYDGGAVSSVSAQLAHSDGDYMFATEFVGTWTGTFSGLQIYRLDEAPVYPPDLWEDTYHDYKTPNGMTPPYDFATTPPSWTWSSVDYYRYWGVFATDWATGASEPEYDVIYNYNGNPSVPATADGTAGNPELGLAYRPTYCFGTWTDSGANWAFGTLQLELLGAADAQSQNGPPKTNPEYVLAGINQPLAIALASFYAEFDRSSECIRITWETATEVDTIGFQIWRSDTKEGPYTLMPGSFIASQSVSETTGAQYSYSDCDADLDTYMTFYYKLEEIDMDLARDNPVYGPIGPITETVSASQFSSSTASTKSGGGCFIDILGD